ncbi:MAG: hypothetical protein ABSC41_03845, partial [Acidimicrobiales bacterium]
DQGSNSILELNPSTKPAFEPVGKVVDRKQPLGSLAIAPDGKMAYAWGDDIVPIDLLTGRILSPISFPVRYHRLRDLAQRSDGDRYE